MWVQRTITFEPRPRGIHLVTREVLGELPELADFEVGILHLLIQHTSASLTLNENASPEVRADLATWLDRAVPEGASNWTHTLEGDDDMPAHVKAALMGPSLTLPLRGGRPALGTCRGSTSASTATAAARARSSRPPSASGRASAVSYGLMARITHSARASSGRSR